MPSSTMSGLYLMAALVASLFAVAASQDGTTNPFTWLDCPSPHSSSIGSVFQSNVFALLDALPSAAAPTGFASLSRGEGSDRAYVRGLCRGDSTPADCASYLQDAVADINGHCNSNRRAAIWYTKSFLTYADTNASTAYEDAFRDVLYNFHNASDRDAFERTYYALMRRLTARAVANNVSASSSSSPPRAPMFATGEVVYDRRGPNGTMYGLVQCMRDRTPAQCERCLQESMKQLPSCCWGNVGGVVLAYNCFLRVETYTYYDLALDAPPAPPPLPPAPSSSQPSVGELRTDIGRKATDMTLAIALPVGTVSLVMASAIIGVFLYKRKANQEKTPPDNSSKEDMSFIEPQQLNLTVLRTATSNFSEENKLGEGGFGKVFKGTLPNGEEIAVKRLSKHSLQGFHELKNELVLAAKLKHKNMVQLLGVCLEQEEKLLIYEYMPNRSLDTFIFDPEKRQMLDWSTRFTIICGIARGLLYLHEESHLRVIHRDLKLSNVLLDVDMHPKISDFGLARAFIADQSKDITRRPVGTLGYMSPEYAYFGHVSTKSDMYSFGVMVLEMVTGRRNSSSYECLDSLSLLSHVWGKWRTGSIADVVDASLGGDDGQCPHGEVLHCVKVGLLCVQENPADRPDASMVVLMLSSPSTSDDRHWAPSRPAFVFSSGSGRSRGQWPYVPAANASRPDGAIVGDRQTSPVALVSENDLTNTELQPR